MKLRRGAFLLLIVFLLAASRRWVAGTDQSGEDRLDVRGNPTASEIRQAVRIRRDEPFSLSVGQRAELVCWGVMPSGMLRHPLFVRWLA